MAGLRNICKLFGGMTVLSGGKKVRYFWDYAADEPATEADMPIGSDRWAASERAKAELMRRSLAAAGKVEGGDG